MSVFHVLLDCIVQITDCYHLVDLAGADSTALRVLVHLTPLVRLDTIVQ